MHIALVAATGKAGTAILEALLRRNHQVTLVVRSPEKLPEHLSGQVHVVRDDFSDIEKLATAIKGAAAVVSAYGPASSDSRYNEDVTYTDSLVEVTKRLIAAVERAAVSRLLVVGGGRSTALLQ